MSRSKTRQRSGGDADYEVGYRKPPVGTQFQKGQSGNPKGRPKSSGKPQDRKQLMEIIRQEGERPLSVGEGGLTTVTAIIRSAMVQAVKGEASARKQIIPLIAEAYSEAVDAADEPKQWDLSKYTTDELDVLLELAGKQETH